MEAVLSTNTNLTISTVQEKIGTERGHSFYTTLNHFGTLPYIKNSNSRGLFVELKDTRYHVLLSPKNFRRSQDYTTSLVAQYLLYAADEVLSQKKYSLFLKSITGLCLPLLKVVAKLAKWNKVVWINNRLVSTSLPKMHWEEDEIEDLKNSLTDKCSDYAIVFRGLNNKTSTEIFEALENQGFKPVSGRKVYLFDPKSKKYKKKRPFQIDKKHAEKQELYYWDTLDVTNPQEIERVLDLYQSLYLEKYSKHNPDYTEKFIRDNHLSRQLTFEVLKSVETGNIEAVQAFVENDEEITTPFIGYNQDLPKEHGLYRLMSHRLIEKSIASEKILNMSSGADTFKQQRGGKPAFEYHLVYYQHLPFLRRLNWALFIWLMNKVAQPLMR